MIRPRIQSLVKRILDVQVLVWILLGFFVSYILFFIAPIFLSGPKMQFFRYVPTGGGDIGADLRLTLNYFRPWWLNRQTPYIGTNLYPPLDTLLFAPLIPLDFATAYTIMTFVNIVCFGIVTFALPLWLGAEKRASPLLLLMFAAGAVSYGFQFELNRGQFNVIAVLLAFSAVWLFHKHPRHRFAAYLLFAISVQLKLYPFIFVLMFVDNWHDWWTNAKRFALLTAGNFALFFALGPRIFLDFINSIPGPSGDAVVAVDNHSISSFVQLAARSISRRGIAWTSQNSGALQAALFILICGCMLLIVLRAYRVKHQGFDPQLLLACCIGALLIPPVSFDYTLSILAAPVSIFLLAEESRRQVTCAWGRVIRIALLFLLALAYSSTLYSFTNRPSLFANSLPALLAMLMALVVLSWLIPAQNLSAHDDPLTETQASA